MDSSSAISSAVSLTDNAPMLCSRFSILVVPGMGTTSFPWWRTQANASCEVVHPFFVASSLILSYMILLCSRFSGCNLGKCYKILLVSNFVLIPTCMAFKQNKILTKITEGNLEIEGTKR
ncbi:hypothetical protein Hanom_Chr14g01280211 [Helianthus anomalus]